MMVVVGSTLVAGSATWPQTSDVAAVAGSGLLAGVLSDTKASDAARTSEVAAFAGSGASGSAQCQRRFRYRKRGGANVPTFLDKRNAALTAEGLGALPDRRFRRTAELLLEIERPVHDPPAPKPVPVQTEAVPKIDGHNSPDKC